MRVGGEHVRHHNNYPLNSKLKEASITGPVVMVDMEEAHTDDAEHNHSSQNAKHAIQNSRYLDTYNVIVFVQFCLVIYVHVMSLFYLQSL